MLFRSFLLAILIAIPGFAKSNEAIYACAKNGFVQMKDSVTAARSSGANDDEARMALRAQIQALVDLQGFAKLSLGHEWRGLSGAGKRLITSAAHTILTAEVFKYIERVLAESITFDELDKKKRTVVVAGSAKMLDDQNCASDCTSSDWEITITLKIDACQAVDMSVEGIGLAKFFKPRLLPN